MKNMLKQIKYSWLIEPLFYLNKSENVKRYRRIRKRLEKKDRAYVKAHPELAPLHRKLNKLKQLQRDEWDSIVYCDGYFYQGFEEIGITGIKPTEKRIKRYQIGKYFDSEKAVLDIGSNAGFLVCHLSKYFRSIDGIEINPYLVEMAKETKDFLEIDNVNFLKQDFKEFNPDKVYDVIFSLSNHHTIDGNLDLDFESYVKKIFRILKKAGIFFFESHNIDGDDRDLEAKFKIASKYFSLVDYKMVKAFQKADIDKLFAIFKRRDTKGDNPQLGFSLEEARKSYQFTSA